MYSYKNIIHGKISFKNPPNLVSIDLIIMKISKLFNKFWYHDLDWIKGFSEQEHFPVNDIYKMSLSKLFLVKGFHRNYKLMTLSFEIFKKNFDSANENISLWKRVYMSGTNIIYINKEMNKYILQYVT